MPDEMTQNFWFWAFLATPLFRLILTVTWSDRWAAVIASISAFIFAGFAFDSAWLIHTRPAFTTGTFDPKFEHLMYRTFVWNVALLLRFVLPWIYPNVWIWMARRLRHKDKAVGELHAA